MAALDLQQLAQHTPGLSGGIVYGAVMRGGRPRGLWQEGALMAGVGASSGWLPSVLRHVVNELAALHQVCASFTCESHPWPPRAVAR